MQLYTPIFFGGKVYVEAEIKKPTPGVLADAHRLMGENKLGSALLAFVSGSIESLTDKEGKIEIKKDQIKIICRDMKQRCIEDIAIDIMLSLDSEDAIEGVYNCPRCHKQKVCESRDGIDTRDYISELEITYFDKEEDYCEIELTEPYERKEKDEVVEVITTLGFKYPTITDYIQCSARYGTKDEIRVQYALYVECLQNVNGVEIDKQWKNRHGMYMIENLKNVKIDLSKISTEINKYGRNNKVKKTCEFCGKEWMAFLNTANFFVSGLQPE